MCQNELSNYYEEKRIEVKLYCHVTKEVSDPTGEKPTAIIRNHTLYVDILSVVRIDRIIAAITNTISAKRIMPARIMVLSSVFSCPMADDDEMIALSPSIPTKPSKKTMAKMSSHTRYDNF